MEEFENRIKKLETALKSIMSKIELIGAYVCNKEQFNHIFDDEYWNVIKYKINDKKWKTSEVKKNEE